MLIITRKATDEVVIANDILITVLGISNGIVRLGVTAPAEIPVYRKELWDRIQRDDQAHVSVEIDDALDVMGVAV